MSGIGHNRGPSLEGGRSWRTHCWQEARASLLPTLPVEVVRLRVRRAREIGLDYRTYAGVRATTGHDIVAFLFSTNALRLLRPADRLAADRGEKLRAVAAEKVLAVHVPLDPARIAAHLAAEGVAVRGAGRAPAVAASWPVMRDRLGELLAPLRRPGDGVLLVGAEHERDWVAAARLAGFLPADSYFPPAGA